MIPDHALSKAIRAYDANTGFPAVFPLALEAAIETVAADLYDAGYDAGRFDGECTSYTRPEDRPYRASETA